MVYFQPILTEDEQEKYNLNSFEAYRYYDNVRKDFPKKDIRVLKDNDIEMPVFIDDSEEFYNL